MWQMLPITRSTDPWRKYTIMPVVWAAITFEYMCLRDTSYRVSGPTHRLFEYMFVYDESWRQMSKHVSRLFNRPPFSPPILLNDLYNRLGLPNNKWSTLHINPLSFAIRIL